MNDAFSGAGRNNALTDLYTELHKVHPGRTLTDSSMERVFDAENIRRMLNWQLPAVDDVSKLVDAQRGRIFAVRMDLLGEGTGLKQPVVAGLIARSLLRLRHVTALESKSGFIDGASLSTGLAMAYYDKKLGTQSMLVTSRMVPDDVVGYIRERSGNALNVSRDKSENPDLETALTLHFMEIMQSESGKPYIPLLHTKYGGAVLRPFGTASASRMECNPDYIVTTLGAGTTLQGMALPIKNNTPGARIVIAEHTSCPLVHNPEIDIHTTDVSGYETDWLNKVIPGKKTAIIGPHENTINPFIAPETLSECAVARYSDVGWQQMAAHCHEKGMPIGPSSAANLYVARSIAQKYNVTVVTFIVEPLRKYHLSRV